MPSPAGALDSTRGVHREGTRLFAACEQAGIRWLTYRRLFRTWFGFPAFAAVLGIYWPMLTRPDLAL